MEKDNLVGTAYWDLFEQRTAETIAALKKGVLPPLRRLSLHITNKCNLRCAYCNEKHSAKELPQELFVKIVREYSAMGGGVLHITGGEPMCVPYLQGRIIELSEKHQNVQFHVNTNATTGVLDTRFLQAIKRMKISLDSCRANYFDELVGVAGSFDVVLDNLYELDVLAQFYPESSPTTSITYTMTRENYKQIPEFVKWFRGHFKYLYAVFFSCYKGADPRFAFRPEDVDDLFTNVVPQMQELWDEFGDTESKFLFHASHDTTTFAEQERFPDNRTLPCYLSEMVIDEDGFVSNCSHLFRDGVGKSHINIRDLKLSEAFIELKKWYDLKPLHEKCLYGCNKKLVRFNKDVHSGLFSN